MTANFFSAVHDFFGDEVRRVERLGFCELDAERRETRHDLGRERESGEQDAADEHEGEQRENLRQWRHREGKEILKERVKE